MNIPQPALTTQGGDALRNYLTPGNRPIRNVRLGPIVRQIPPRVVVNDSQPITPVSSVMSERDDPHSCGIDDDHDHDHDDDQDCDHFSHRNDRDDQSYILDGDDYDHPIGSDSGNKKRKVPNFYVPANRLADRSQSGDEGTQATDKVKAGNGGESKSSDASTLGLTAPAQTRNITGNGWRSTYISKERIAAHRALGFRKVQFLRRKAALITLYLDCQKALLNNTSPDSTSSIPAPTSVKAPASDVVAKQAGSKANPTGGNQLNLPGKKRAPLVDVDEFEKLLPGLEYFGVSEWAPDSPEWRNNWNDVKTDGEVDKKRSKPLGAWKANYDRKKRDREAVKPVVRGGWFPEGSFEYECPSKAGALARERSREKIALQRLAVELRSLLHMVRNKSPSVKTVSTETRSKTKRKGEDKSAAEVNPPRTQSPAPSSVEKTASKDGSEVGSNAPANTGKKKPKKKKRSALANQSNPHHVDNYRPSRTLNASANPYEPYPHHANLLFPPSMRLLSARPQNNSSTPLSRPAEDEYICCFCEFYLYYGTERQRRHAIQKRREEMKRKETIKVKAKNVAEGKGKLKDDDEDEDDYDDDEECVDDGYGRCSCGRSLGPPNKAKERLKTLDSTTDPQDDHSHHHPDHDHHDPHDHHDHHDHHHHPEHHKHRSHQQQEGHARPLQNDPQTVPTPSTVQPPISSSAPSGGFLSFTSVPSTTFNPDYRPFNHGPVAPEVTHPSDSKTSPGLAMPNSQFSGLPASAIHQLVNAGKESREGRDSLNASRASTPSID